MAAAVIVGHQEVRARLQQAIKSGHVASAYLLAGPDGVGKKLVALEFAQALNCQRNYPEKEPCGACVNCRKIGKGLHPEIKIISRQDKSNVIKIDQVRELQADIMLRPLEARTKVFILDDAHLMTLDAANCLLKTLEEPPADSVLILISANPAILPATILSRCQRISFLPLTEKEMTALLKESEPLTREQLAFLAVFAQGSVGLAEHYLAADIFEKKKELDDFIRSLPHRNCEHVFDATQKLGWDKEKANLVLDLLLYSFARERADDNREIVDLVLHAKQNVFRNINLRLTLENIFLRIKNA